ncbi:MAG: hypothetical protein DYG91_14355, partial [Chloroflexi bacterium CFX7]|nr:hypothetical protein [Chloroflexi bacterium CFX7]
GGGSPILTTGPELPWDQVPSGWTHGVVTCTAVRCSALHPEDTAFDIQRSHELTVFEVVFDDPPEHQSVLILDLVNWRARVVPSISGVEVSWDFRYVQGAGLPAGCPGLPQGDGSRLFPSIVLNVGTNTLQAEATVDEGVSGGQSGQGGGGSAVSDTAARSVQGERCPCTEEDLDHENFAGGSVEEGDPDQRHHVTEDTYAYTALEHVDIEISACRDGANWRAVLTGLRGVYSVTYLEDAFTEASTAQITEETLCGVLTDFQNDLNGHATGGHYLRAAVEAHEAVHVSHAEPAIHTAARAIEPLVEAMTIPHQIGMTQSQATAAIRASEPFQDVLEGVAFTEWEHRWVFLTDEEHDHDLDPASGGGESDRDGFAFQAELGPLNEFRTTKCQEFPNTGCEFCAHPITIEGLPQP